MSVDLGAFREVLFTWAAEQLERHSSHTGPFRVLGVRVDTMRRGDSEDPTELIINFEHDDCTEYVWQGHPRCTVGAWAMPSTDQTVTMLNEVLSLVDRPAVSSGKGGLDGAGHGADRGAAVSG